MWASCYLYPIHLWKVVNKRAVGFAETTELSAQGISQRIFEVLEPLRLDPSLCVVQVRAWRGVWAIMKETFSKAVLVQPNSQLNLVLCTGAHMFGHGSTFF